MDQLFALGHVYSGAQILTAGRIDLARQFALRLQLSANTHTMPEVRPVRPKKRSALIKPSLLLLLEATSHTAMGIAVGLAFAFLATHITALGIATLINYSPTPDVVMIMCKSLDLI